MSVNSITDSEDSENRMNKNNINENDAGKRNFNTNNPNKKMILAIVIISTFMTLMIITAIITSVIKCQYELVLTSMVIIITTI